MKLYLFLLISTFIFSLLEISSNITRYKLYQLFQKVYIFFYLFLFIFNRDNSDYNNYVNYFEGQRWIISENGYLLFTQLIKKIGGNHNIIILIVGIFSFYVIFYKYKIKYVLTFLFLYTFYSFAYDINQIRNLLVISLVLLCLDNIIKKRKKYRYLICSVLTIFFQRIGYIYIFFYLFQKVSLKNYKKILFGVFISGFLLMLNFEKFVGIFFPEKLYYFQNKPRFGVTLYFILILMDIILMNFIKYNNKIDSIYEKFILYPIIFLPYSFLTLELISRVWRNTLYLKWFYFLNKVSRKTQKEKWIVYCILTFEMVFYMLVWLYKNPEAILNIISQVDNIKLYF